MVGRRGLLALVLQLGVMAHVLLQRREARRALAPIFVTSNFSATGCMFAVLPAVVSASVAVVGGGCGSWVLGGVVSGTGRGAGGGVGSRLLRGRLGRLLGRCLGRCISRLLGRLLGWGFCWVLRRRRSWVGSGRRRRVGSRRRSLLALVLQA